jgi:membrane associated rhomboid family serine protease
LHKLTLSPMACALVVISVVVFCIGLFPGFPEVIEPAGGLIPARFHGSDSDLAEVATMLPAWLTPFTAPFINIGFLDLLLRSLMLLFLGSLIEKILGWQGVLLLFFAGAIASAAMLVLLLPESLRAHTGSFNANSAIVAGYLILHPIAKSQRWRGLSADQARSLQLLFLWLILNLAIGFPTSFDALAERVIAPVAAFGAGLLLARPLLLMKYRQA